MITAFELLLFLIGLLGILMIMAVIGDYIIQPWLEKRYDKR